MDLVNNGRQNARNHGVNLFIDRWTTIAARASLKGYSMPGHVEMRIAVMKTRDKICWDV